MIPSYWDITRILTRGQFVLRAGMYAGRPPSTSDLNSEILEAIYGGIKNEFGIDQATNFVRFVNKLRDLSASSFIVAFEQFIGNECSVIDIEQQRDDRNTVDSGEEMHPQGFCVIAHALSGLSTLSEDVERRSFSIKHDFIRKHQEEIPVDERNFW